VSWRAIAKKAEDDEAQHAASISATRRRRQEKFGAIPEIDALQRVCSIDCRSSTGPCAEPARRYGEGVSCSS
jgi:hypothetical protein